jgi:hypothetical protein
MSNVINLFSRRKVDDDGVEQPPTAAPKESTLDIPALTNAYNKKKERMNEDRKQSNASVTRSYRLHKKPKG